MLSKEYRIPTKLIPQIVKTGKRKYSDNFTLIKSPDETLIMPKFAFVVSKRLDKRATVRNRIKRRVRAAIYSILKDQKINSANYIFLCNKEKIKDINFDALKSELNSLLI